MWFITNKAGLMGFISRGFIFCLVFSFTVSGVYGKNIVRIVASGETHAMIEPCDCPGEPGGGLAKRSFILKTLGTRSELLLLDAGGFCGGGIYDMYTEGRKNDSIRTLVTINGMGQMNYDAVAVGDDDLQYGGEWLVKHARSCSLPLVSANCFLGDKYLADPYVIVKKGEHEFAITAVTTTENLFPIDKKVTVNDPVRALKKIWKEMTEKSDYQIIISHLGQELSARLEKSFPQCDLIVNGHRKTDSDVILNENVPILQFNFQGKALAVAEMETGNKGLGAINSYWLPVDNDTPDDSTLVLKLQENRSRIRPVYDLYIMSMCPYGLEALTGFMEFVEAFPDVEWNLWFIGDVDSDTVFNSLHGENEVNDEMVWCAVKELYPDIWKEFLRIRSGSYSSTESILNNFNIDQEKIDSWIKSNGKKVLHAHYLRSIRQNINASPTLLVNNYPYRDKISKSRLGKVHCNMLPDASAFCDSVPECFTDNDCKKKGKIGRCLGTGNCEFRDALPFGFIAVVADSTVQKPQDEIIETTMELFPGANVEIVGYSSAKGQELIKKFNPAALPLYLFEKDVQHAHNYMSIESGLVRKGDYFLFKRGVVQENYHFKREYLKGDMVLFVDPFYTKIDEVLGPVINDSSINKKVKIYPVFQEDPDEVHWGTQEKFRHQEAMRWLLLGKEYQIFVQYLREYIKDPPDSYWFTSLKKTGIDIDSLAEVAKKDTEVLTNHKAFLDELLVTGPVMVMVDNRELVAVRNSQDLQQVLDSRVGPR